MSPRMSAATELVAWQGHQPGRQRHGTHVPIAQLSRPPRPVDDVAKWFGVGRAASRPKEDRWLASPCRSVSLPIRRHMDSKYGRHCQRITWNQSHT